jgi:hypothetical protein
VVLPKVRRSGFENNNSNKFTKWADPRLRSVGKGYNQSNGGKEEAEATENWAIYG